MPRHLRLVLSVLVAQLVATGCSYWVDGDWDTRRCSGQSHAADECPSDAFCLDGVCTRCQEADYCGNRVDDDCDGQADEGCYGARGSPSGECSSMQCANDDVCVVLNDGTQPECLEACCSSADCAGGAVCRAVANANYRLVCVGTNALHALGEDVSGAGGQAVGESCASNETCRSAFCSDNGVCADVCCDASDCPNATHCVPVTDGPWNECVLPSPPPDAAAIPSASWVRGRE